MSDYDVVVIGGGAAGLSAALVLTRARRRVAVIDAGQPRNAPAAHMQGFLGSDGMPPGRAARRGPRRGRRLRRPPRLRHRRDVTASASAATRAAGSTSRLDGRPVRSTRRVLVTTGLRDDIPDIPGVRERWGRDLLHCPVLPRLRGPRPAPRRPRRHTRRRSRTPSSIRQWSDDVVLFANGTALTADQREQLIARAIGVVDAPVARLVVEDDQLTGVELDAGRVVPRTAVFVRPRFVPTTAC